MPWPVALALSVGITAKISNADRDTLQGLSKLGFKLEFGIDGAGILRQIVSRAGGYYIDVGCCQLIFDGLVKVKHSPGGIKAFDKTGIILGDGSHLDADIVVLATGYESMNESARQVLGDKVADRCNQVWGLDEEAELRTVSTISSSPIGRGSNSFVTDMEAKWTSWLLVHGRQSCNVSHLLQIRCPADCCR